MTVATDDFSAWLTQARVAEHRLTPDQRGVLFAAFHFRQSQGDDSYSTRLLSHFLLHAQTGLKVAQIARLVGVSRPTASGQQGMSSKEAVQQAHHRMDGRPYGKLLPRFAGPIIEFLLARPQATRADLIDFIDQTFGVHVSRIALYKFLKKFGLDQVPAGPNPPSAAGPAVPATPHAATPGPRPPDTRPAVTPAGAPAPPFCSGARASQARS
jgi:transposase